MKKFWKGYNTWNADNSTVDSWAEIKELTVNDRSKQLCPEFVINVEEAETPEGAMK